MGFFRRRRIRHPFYPAVKIAPAAGATRDYPALYGAYEELSTAAETGLRLARAVFPLRPLTSPFLPDPERDDLWRMFRVPVFALLVNGDGAVVACECEAQDGFHLRQGYHAGMLSGRVETRLCECGRPGPRLMPPAAAKVDAEDARLAG